MDHFAASRGSGRYRSTAIGVFAILDTSKSETLQKLHLRDIHHILSESCFRLQRLSIWMSPFQRPVNRYEDLHALCTDVLRDDRAKPRS